MALTMFNPLFGQELSHKQNAKLKGFGIDYEQIIDNNSSYSDELRLILEKDRKYNRNKTVGFVLGGLGILTAAGGILIITERDGNGLSRAIVGGGITALGAIEMGVSIPLFSSSKKRKKERDKLISGFNPK